MVDEDRVEAAVVVVYADPEANIEVVSITPHTLNKNKGLCTSCIFLRKISKQHNNLKTIFKINSLRAPIGIPRTARPTYIS